MAKQTARPLPAPAPPMHAHARAVLRHAARIGDLWEAFLSPDLVTAHGGEDGIGFIR